VAYDTRMRGIYAWRKKHKQTAPKSWKSLDFRLCQW